MINNNLHTFKLLVEAAAENEGAELAVRELMGRFAKSCPLNLLLELANKVAEYRKQEIVNHIQKN